MFRGNFYIQTRSSSLCAITMFSWKRYPTKHALFRWINRMSNHFTIHLHDHECTTHTISNNQFVIKGWGRQANAMLFLCSYGVRGAGYGTLGTTVAFIIYYHQDFFSNFFKFIYMTYIYDLYKTMIYWEMEKVKPALSVTATRVII